MLHEAMAVGARHNVGGPQPNLELFRQMNGSSIAIDESLGILKITWVNIVDEETAMEMIQTIILVYYSMYLFVTEVL